MKSRATFRNAVKKLFKKDEAQHERPEADKSLSTTPPSNTGIQVTETFPAGVEDWVKCDDADVDICFIHGLTGNRASTWTAKGQTEPWPKELLPAELPNIKARIFTYGYDAYIIRREHASSNQLTDHAISFLQKVTADREKNKASDRPLIIVAHSLGGLVSKQAILKSKNSPEAHLQNLYNMTKGIIFMGTPHTGSWIADWLKIPIDIFGILKSTNTTLLRVLQTQDELLLSLNADFLYLLRTLREGPKDGQKISVICFFEELGYPKFGHIVSKTSATFASDLPISVHANHSDMVKFATTKDEGFQSVAAELRRWIAEISKVTTVEIPVQLPRDPVEVALRLFNLPKIESARKAMESCMKALGLEDDANLLLRSMANQETTKQLEKTEQRIKDAYRGAAARCRRSLAFKDMMTREEIIAQPESETGQWIYQDSQYKKWITNDRPLLWVKGNPGSGKSILMKSLFKRRQQDLKCTSTILLRFFFNARGSDIETSPEALYRTLLHSLIEVDPLLLCEVLALYLEKDTRGDSVQWQTTELADVFHDKLQQFQSKDIEILIDALDECSDAEVLDVVRRFERSIQAPRNYTSLRVCWSSRFYPNISLRAVQGIELILNEKNTDDIREYIQKSFPTDSHEPLRLVGEDIIARAKGIFLWASLVAKKLTKAFDAGKNASQLTAMLHVIPDDLDNYFLEIFNEPGFTTGQREDLQRIALFVLGASRPLSVEELYTALMLKGLSSDRSFSDITLRSEDTQQFKKRLTHSSGGLIEVINIERASHHSDLKVTTRVQVIHESVREFFLGKGLSVLQASSRETFLTECHSGITQAGFNGLSRMATDLDATRHYQGNKRSSINDEMLNTLVPRNSWCPPEIPFLVDYVRDYIFEHFEHVRRALADEGEKGLWLPSAKVCQQALYAYLRIGCFEVIQHSGLKESMNQQLRIVSKHANAFELDGQVFADVLDFPNRLMATSEFLKRRGIYLFKNVSSISSPTENMHRFLALFSARFQNLIVNSPLLAASPLVQDKNPTAIMPDVITYGDCPLSPPKERLESLVPLFGISFLIPASMVGRLMLPNRLSSPDPHSYDRDEVIFPVNINNWQVVSVIDPELYSLLPNDLQSRPGGQLTFSTPSVLDCRLIHWASVEDDCQMSETKPVFIQAGECTISWQGVFEEDRKTLFKPMIKPETWAFYGDDIPRIGLDFETLVID